MRFVKLLAAGDLSDAQIEHWSQTQATNPELQSPFFHPLYTREAAACFPGVEVAILEAGDGEIGYFPFQRTAGNVGLPVGESLNDFQGVIARPGFTFDAAALLRGCRLAGLRFTQILASQAPFRPYHWIHADSPSLDLHGGFEAYCRGRREAGSQTISRYRRKRRAAIGDLGPLRFEPQAEDSRELESLVAWKSRQYKRIGAFNVFARPGVLDFLRRLLALGTAEFQGLLSAMYLGDRLAAVHLGLRCGKVLHLWFPAYNPQMEKYSPGSIYFLEQAAAAESLGIDRLDLGCGNERFKASLRSFGTPVAEGAIGMGAFWSSLQRTWLHTKRWVQSSRWHGPARAVVRGIRGFFLYGVRDGATPRKP